MKKSISILLILFLLTALMTGCRKKGTIQETAATASPKEETKTEIIEKTEAPTEAPATEAPTEPAHPILGKWLGIYVDMDGFKMPMGRDQGFAIDFLLEEDGKATYFLYLNSEGAEEEVTVSADWSGDETAFQIHSEDKDMPGTFQCRIEKGVLIVEDLLGEGSTFKMAKEGSPEVALLKEESQLFQDILDAMEEETAESAAP